MLHCLGPSTSRCSAWLIQLQDKRKKHLSNPTMVGKHLQKGKQDVCEHKAWTGKWECGYCSVLKVGGGCIGLCGKRQWGFAEAKVAWVGVGCQGGGGITTAGRCPYHRSFCCTQKQAQGDKRVTGGRKGFGMKWSLRWNKSGSRERQETSSSHPEQGLNPGGYRVAEEGMRTILHSSWQGREAGCQCVSPWQQSRDCWSVSFALPNGIYK